MATLELPLLGKLLPDGSASVYPSTLSQELSLTNAKAAPVMVVLAPSGSDIGLEGSFVLPQNYVGTPKLVVRGVLDGTPANVLGFGCQQVAIDDTEAADVAYEAEDTASISSWTGYADEDLFELVITLTPTATYAAGKTVWLKVYRDDSVDTTTFSVLLTDVSFQYADA